MTSWGLAPQELLMDRFRECWATWTVAVKNNLCDPAVIHGRGFNFRFRGWLPWRDVLSWCMVTATQDMSDKLAGCAFALFSNRGIDRVRMDDIAASAGVTKGSLYWHYRSKGEVIHAACQHYYEGWHAQMKREISKAPTPGKRLARAIRASVRTCLIDDANRTFTLELFTLSIHDEAVRKGWRAFFDGVKSFYISLLGEAIAGGEIAAGDPEAAVDLMLAAMEGYKLRALFEPKLCARGAERRIAAKLLEIVGSRE